MAGVGRTVGYGYECGRGCGCGRRWNSWTVPRTGKLVVGVNMDVDMGKDALLCLPTLDTIYTPCHVWRVGWR